MHAMAMSRGSTPDFDPSDRMDGTPQYEYYDCYAVRRYGCTPHANVYDPSCVACVHKDYYVIISRDYVTARRYYETIHELNLAEQDCDNAAALLPALLQRIEQLEGELKWALRN